jgi:ribosomal protein S18 acetylase RimI-like enzyme
MDRQCARRAAERWLITHVRLAIPGDEPILRALRLEALSDAPDAFGSTYERELARTNADWRRWLSPGATFLLTDDDGPKGIVAGAHDAADPGIVQLMAMWVHTSLRGHGAADALVLSVLAWSSAEGARATRLAVIESNTRARRCYERNGFRDTGKREVRERDGVVEMEMEHRVDSRGGPWPPAR